MISYFQLANIYIRGVQIKYIKVTIFQKLSYILFLKVTTLVPRKLSPGEFTHETFLISASVFYGFYEFQFCFFIEFDLALWLHCFILNGRLQCCFEKEKLNRKMTTDKSDDRKHLLQWRIQKILGTGDFFQKQAQKSSNCFYVEVMQIKWLNSYK